MDTITHADTSKGIFDKYHVTRKDGQSGRGKKHHGCNYFVLDIDHDPIALECLKVYSEHCKVTDPDLAQIIQAVIFNKSYFISDGIGYDTIELGVDGNCAYARVGPNIQAGEVEFVELGQYHTNLIEHINLVKSHEEAVTRLKNRLGLFGLKVKPYVNPNCYVTTSGIIGKSDGKDLTDLQTPDTGLITTPKK